MSFYVNVLELMLPRPKLKCTLHNDRAESLSELGIIKVSATDCDYHEDKVNRLY